MNYVINIESTAVATEIYEGLTSPESDLSANAGLVVAHGSLANHIEHLGNQIAFDDEVLSYLRRHRADYMDGCVEDTPEGPVMFFGGTGYLVEKADS